jgi:hypothetical protein
MCALESWYFVEWALKKGATEFDFDKLIPRLNTVKVATWVVKALKIDVSSHLLTRELARKVSIDNLEFLFDQGIASFTIWLARALCERVLHSRSRTAYGSEYPRSNSLGSFCDAQRQN